MESNNRIANDDCVMEILNRIDNVFDYYMASIVSQQFLACAKKRFSIHFPSMDADALLYGKLNGLGKKSNVTHMMSFLLIFGIYIRHITWSSLRDVYRRSAEDMEIIDLLCEYCPFLETLNENIFNHDTIHTPSIVDNYRGDDI